MVQVHVKNMVCDRCIKSVVTIFRRSGASVKEVGLGVVTLDKELDSAQEKEIRSALLAEGFEWLDDQKIKLKEQIKKEILQLVHYAELDEMKENLSDYLSSRLHKDYHYISN